MCGCFLDASKVFVWYRDYNGTFAIDRAAYSNCMFGESQELNVRWNDNVSEG